MMNYEKATAEVVYFTNRDVITTSGGLDIDGCRNNGQDNGNGCHRGNSGACVGGSWKQ